MCYWAPVIAVLGGTENILNLLLDWLPVIPAPSHCFYFQKIHQGEEYVAIVNAQWKQIWLTTLKNESFYIHTLQVPLNMLSAHLDPLMAYAKHASRGMVFQICKVLLTPVKTAFCH